MGPDTTTSPTPQPERPRTIVVGGGLAGLVAANHLLDAGHRVEVLDGAGHLGGRAHATTDGGAARNLGPHAVYRRGHLRRALARLGIPVPGSSPNLLRLRVLADGTPIPGDRILRRLPGLWRLRRVPGAGQSLAAWLDDRGVVGEARSLAEALARTTTYANAPALMDAAAARDQILLSMAGVVYVDGGWRTLVRALERRLVAGGGLVTTGAGVHSIAAGSDGVVVERRDGVADQADGVVVAVGSPRDAGRLLLGEVGTALRRRRDVPVRMATLDLVLRDDDVDRPGPHGVLGDGRDPRYLLVPSRVARLGPIDREVVHVARYLAPGEKGDQATRTDLEGLLDAWRPRWREHVEATRFLPNLIVTHALPLAEAGGRHGRAPVVPDPDLPIALAGDAVGSEGLLADAAAASAAAAAAHVGTLLATRVPARKVEV